MQKLDHPNIMKLLNHQEDEQCLYLIMDLMVEDLRNVMLQNGKVLKESLVRKIFI